MEIPVQDLNEKVQEIIAERERSYRRQFSAAEKHVLKSVSSLEKAAISLKEAIARAWGTISKPAEQHGTRLSEQLLEACRSMATHRPDAAYESLSKFQEESEQTVRAIAKAYNRYVPSIIRRVKSETSIIGDSIAALDRSITELGQVLDDSNLKKLQLIATDAEHLARSAHELSLRIHEIQKAKETVGEVQDRETKIEQDLSLLGRDQGLIELNQIEQQIGQREAEIIALLEPILKPLRKICRTDSKALDGPSRTTVSKVLENPLVAVLEIQAGQMRELLFSVSQSLERDELFPDQRRKRKAAEAIQALQSGGLERFREDHGILEANRREVLRQLKGSGIYDQWLSLRKQSDDLRAEITQCQNRIVELQSQEMRLRTSVLADKELMESALRKVLDDQVSILV